MDDSGGSSNQVFHDPGFNSDYKLVMFENNEDLQLVDDISKHERET